MAYINRMTTLLKKIEQRLGTDEYNLPAKWAKDKWADEVIDLVTLDTFSRFYPNKIRVTLNTNAMKLDNGYYIIDEEEYGPDVEILGVKDIAWDDPNAFGQQTGIVTANYPFNVQSAMPMGYTPGEMALIQAGANENSLYNNGIYIDFQRPNKIKLVSALGIEGPSLGVTSFIVDLLVRHNKNLSTISPTIMETFEELAISDVATFLYNKLKFYDKIETVFTNADLHLEELQEAAQNRKEIVQLLKESYVSPENTNQPSIITI